LTEQTLERVARVQRIGQMGQRAFRLYLDTLVQIRSAIRRRVDMGRLGELATELDVLEATTAEAEKREDELEEG
jgi:hypothetical protein